MKTSPYEPYSYMGYQSSLKPTRTLKTDLHYFILQIDNKHENLRRFKAQKAVSSKISMSD